MVKCAIYIIKYAKEPNLLCKVFGKSKRYYSPESPLTKPPGAFGGIVSLTLVQSPFGSHTFFGLFLMSSILPLILETK